MKLNFNNGYWKESCLVVELSIINIIMGSKWWTVLYMNIQMQRKNFLRGGVGAGVNSWMSESQNSWMIHKNELIHEYVHEWFTKYLLLVRVRVHERMWITFMNIIHEPLMNAVMNKVWTCSTDLLKEPTKKARVTCRSREGTLKNFLDTVERTMAVA